MADAGRDDRDQAIDGLFELWDHGTAADADALLQWLGQETDSDLLEFVIDTLSALECRTAVSALVELGHNLDYPPEIRRAALNAANELTWAV